MLAGLSSGCDPASAARAVGAPVMRGSAVLAVLVVLGGVVSRNTHEPSRDVRVGGSGTTAAIEPTTTAAPPAPSTTLAAAAGVGAGAPRAPVAADPPRAAGSAVGAGGAAVSGEVAPSSAAPAPSIAAAKPKNVAKAAPSASQAPGTSAPPAAQVTSIDGQAGSIEVQYTDTSMILHAVSPLPGWSVADTESERREHPRDLRARVGGQQLGRHRRPPRRRRQARGRRRGGYGRRERTDW